MTIISIRLTSSMRDWLSFAAVILLAAFIRLSDIGVAQYRYDEATLSGLAQEIVAGRNFPLLGLSTTTGVPWSPMSIYLMTVPYAVSNSALAATVFVALLNIVGTGLLWWLARQFINPTVAFFAGMTYALNPWAVLTSRMIWTPNLIAPFMILAVLLGCYGFIAGKKWGQILCLPVFIIAAQIHPQGVAVLPVYLWLLWVGRQHLFYRGLFLSVILAALTTVPYLAGLSQISADEKAAIDNLVGSEGRTFTINTQTFPLITQYTTGLGVENWVLSRRQFRDLYTQLPPPAPLWFVMGGLTLLGIPAAWRRNRQTAGILTLWAGLPLLVLTLGLTQLQIHYFVVCLPALSLLAALGLAWLANHLLSKQHLVRIGLIGIWALILLTQGFWWRGLVNYLNTTYTPDGFGTPLHFMMQVREQLLDYDDVVIIGGGARTSSWIWRPMLNELACVREAVMPEGGIAVFPAKSFAALYPPDAAENAVDERIRAMYQTGQETVYPLREGEKPYTVYSFLNAPEWLGPSITDIAPARFDNGVQLTGYALQTDMLYLRWQLNTGNPKQNYQYFGHFLDTAGEKIGQRDTSFWPSKYWCASDTVITWINIEKPDVTERVLIGMYALENGGFLHSSVIDKSGSAIGSFVEITP